MTSAGSITDLITERLWSQLPDALFVACPAFLDRDMAPDNKDPLYLSRRSPFMLRAAFEYASVHYAKDVQDHIKLCSGAPLPENQRLADYIRSFYQPTLLNVVYRLASLPTISFTLDELVEASELFMAATDTPLFRCSPETDELEGNLQTLVAFFLDVAHLLRTAPGATNTSEITIPEYVWAHIPQTIESLATVLPWFMSCEVPPSGEHAAAYVVLDSPLPEDLAQAFSNLSELEFGRVLSAITGWAMPPGWPGLPFVRAVPNRLRAELDAVLCA